MNLDMERRESVCFMHSDEEDEDHMRRISMCLSIDISERLKRQNRIHNLKQLTTTERSYRNPGGGLFGNAEDRHPHRSFMSFTVPNRFYADSRDDSHAYDSYNKSRIKEARRRPSVPWPSEQYIPDCYAEYNPVEHYDYPRPLMSHRSQRNYTPPRYEEPLERPRRVHYNPREFYDQHVYKETIPQFVYQKKRARPAQNSEQNFHIYNCDYSRKFSNRSRSGESIYYPENSHRRKSGYSDRDYQPFIETRSSPRSESYYYDDSEYYRDSPMFKSPPHRKKSVEFFAQDCEIPYNVLKRPRHTNQRHKYTDNLHRLGLSSVDIPYRRKRRKHYTDYRNDSDLEVVPPQRTESGSDVCRPRKRVIDDNFPICYKKHTRRFNPLTRSSQRLMQESQLCCKKSRKSLKEKLSGFFKRCKCKSRTKCCRVPRVSRKSKTCLDTLKSHSSSSCAVMPCQPPVCKPSKCCGTSITKRTKCIAYPTVYRDKCPCSIDDNDVELLASPSLRPKVNCSQFECGTSKCCCESCRQSEASCCPPCTRVNVEAPSYCSFSTEEAKRTPRVLLDCPGTADSSSSCVEDVQVVSCPIRKTQRKACCGSSRASKKKLSYQCCSSAENTSSDSCAPRISPVKVCCTAPQSAKKVICHAEDSTSCPIKPSLLSLCGAAGNGLSCQRKPLKKSDTPKQMCCCASCVNEILLNHIKQSTINVCLKICTPEGNLLETSGVTATLERDMIPAKVPRPCCSENILTSPPPSVVSCSYSERKTSSVCPSETSTNCGNISSVICVNPTRNKSDSTSLGSLLCLCNNQSFGSKTQLKSSSNASETSTLCTDNNYINRNTDLSSSRPESNTSCVCHNKPKSILSTSRKCSAQSCTPCNRKTEENQCSEQAKAACPCKLKTPCTIAKQLDRERCSKKTPSRKAYCKPKRQEECAEKQPECCDARKSGATAKDCGAKDCCLVGNNAIQCKKSNARVEFACAPPVECPQSCVNQPSLVEELKKELLKSLKRDQTALGLKPVQQRNIYACACQPTRKPL